MDYDLHLPNNPSSKEELALRKDQSQQHGLVN